MKTWIYLLLITVIWCCKKEDDSAVPTVKSIEIANITEESAISGGDILSNGGSTITSYGLCVSNAPDPVIPTHISGSYLGSGKFTVVLKSLNGNTTYYVRAYATNSAGTGYSETIIFKTLPSETVTDKDGNVYTTVKVGDQTWLAQNLVTTKFKNGDPIPMVSNNTTWSFTSAAARCWYGNLMDSYQTNGILYNGYVVNDPRGIAPSGYHIASAAEWKTLMDKIYTDKITTDFQFYYGGNRQNDGIMGQIYGTSTDGKDYFNWRLGWSWTSTPGTKGSLISMKYNDLGTWSTVESTLTTGCNIRCIKDSK